jgi:molybdenum cofactor guanylyltransferase
MNKIGAAVILNGGKSSRMGQNKSEMRIEGQTLLDRAIDLVSPLCEKLYVSGIESHPRHATLPDYKKNIGPMGGILGALEALPQESDILFIPVDMPFLTKETLQKLIDAASNTPSVLVDSKGMAIPVVACYTRASRADFLNQVESGNYSLQFALKNLEIKSITAESAKECMNVNTPEDFRLISEL